MFNTIAAIIVAISLVLPGFIIADLAEARRAQRSARSDWELVLRALIYALVLQSIVLLTGWTTHLIDTAGLLRHARPGMTPVWEHHVDAIALYVVVVILLVPTIIGLALGWILRRAEGRGSLTWIHYALGGRDARDAWDYIFQRYGAGFILVHLKPGDEQRHPFIVGKFGRTSWAAQTPTTARDVYFEEVWPSSADGQITEEFAVSRGVWLDSSQIDAMFFIDPPGTPPRFRHRAGAWLRHHRPRGRRAVSPPPAEGAQAGE
ncbi:MAG: DUF6338 family protein [Terriglobales bacterium]